MMSDSPMQKFKDLLEKYVSNKATPAEVAEFLNLARDSRYAELIEQLMDERFGNHYEGLKAEERVEVIEHIISTGRHGKYTRRYLMAAAITALLAVAGIWASYNPGFFNSPEVAEQGRFFSASGRDYVSLPDGSTVIVKEGGTLYYEESFGKESRNVTLTGEAYFDVMDDAARPFIVRTGAITTTVLGTAFNINAADTGQVTVTVKRGKVSVADDQHAEIININEQIIVRPSTREFFRTSVDADSLLRWVNNYFILDRVTMAEAARLVGKRFHVDVVIANDDLKECEITAWFLNNEDLEQVIEAISAVRQAMATFKDGKVIIEGGIGCTRESPKENHEQNPTE